jgi:hypothetical protein
MVGRSVRLKKDGGTELAHVINFFNWYHKFAENHSFSRLKTLSKIEGFVIHKVNELPEF